MELKNLPLIAQHIDSGTGVTILSVILDRENVTFDAGALHGSSAVETGIAFDGNDPISPDARLIYTIWMGVRAGSNGADGYYSAVASPLYIDETTSAGWRQDTHFTDIITAIRGTVRVEGLSTIQMDRLRDALREHDSNMWERRSVPLRDIWPD